MNVFLLTIAILALAMLAMGIGLFFGRRCIRISCGSKEPVKSASGESLVCPRCEREIKDRAKEEK